MGRIGHGYGSEWHLLRFLGRHRNRLNQEVLATSGADSVEWLDSPFGRGREDAEWKGLDFLPDAEVRAQWSQFWPQTGNVQNWDAVGQIRAGGEASWLLVEAKAHESEMRSSCGAKGEGRRKIQAALAATKSALGVTVDADWENGYYQYCNRLATLHFLTTHGVSAQLFFVHFVGDEFPDGRVCPATVQDWEKAVAARDDHVALPEHHILQSRIWDLFLDVTGP